MQYNINTGVKYAKSKTKRFIVGAVSLVLPAAFIFQGMASAAAPAQYPFNLVPYEYVGAAGDCGTGSPAGNPDMVSSEWVKTTGNTSPSIKLQKLGLTTNCIAAGVKIITTLKNTAVSGLTELNFDC